MSWSDYKFTPDENGNINRCDICDEYGCEHHDKYLKVNTPKLELSDEILKIMKENHNKPEVKELWNNISPEDQAFYDLHRNEE